MLQRKFMPVLAAAIAGLVGSGVARAQMYPVQATGWNRDIVVERTATAPWSAVAQSFDTFNNWSWYERGLGTSTLGLPQGGAFASVVDPTTLGQLQPYDAPNALFLDVTTPTGSLTLAPAAQVKYDTMAIFASSSNQGGLGTLVITFTDTSTSAPINLNAQDWFNVTTNNALNSLGRANLTSDTVEATTGSNPRIYQTTIDMVALGLNNRNVQSISFTKPAVGGAAQNTVVMGISGRRSVLQLNPIAATGWNRDIVVESGASAPFSGFASSFDVGNNLALYETTLPGSTKGLPVGGGFNSLSNPAIHAQLEPYNASNALFMNATVTATTGTLTLAPAAQVPYEFLAVFASSAGGGGAGGMVITFTDSSTSGNIPYNAQDWFNTTTNNALNNLGRSNLNTSVVDDVSAGNPRLYQTVVDMAALGFNNRAIASITFTKPTAATNSVVMALSGQPASSLPGACCSANGTCASATLPNCVSPNLFQGPGSTCGAGNICPVGTSACCNTTSGVCVYVAGTVCASGFNNQGAGSVCSPSPCPQTGACCSDSGACSLSNAAGCASPSLFQGLGTACGAGNSCPTAVGACCNDLFASCTFISGSTCPVGSTFQGAGSVCSPNSCVGQPSICENFDATPIGGLPTGWTTTVPVGVGAPWSVDGTQSHSAPNSVFTNDVATVSSQLLELPAITAAGPVTLNLWSFFTTESTFDGWVVETSVNGSVFTNIGDAAWTLNGYNATISANFASPILGQRAFSGASATWTERRAVIPANAGDSVIVRFHMATDSSVTSTGVWLDDICLVNILQPATGVCCRGATCTATITSSAACSATLVGGQTAGASFPTGAACNTGGSTTTPCCYADYNKVGGITVNDIFDFLSDWFAGSPYANTGGNGGPGALSVQNIFDFLGAWFAGGC